MLVKPKAQDPKEKKKGVIYSYQCGAITVERNIWGKPPGVNTKESISKSPPPYMHTAYMLVISSAQTNST